MSRTILLTGLLAVATSGLQLGHSGTTVATHQNLFSLFRRSPADSAAMRGGSNAAATSRASSSQKQSQQESGMSSQGQLQQESGSESGEQSGGEIESEIGGASDRMMANSAFASSKQDRVDGTCNSTDSGESSFGSDASTASEDDKLYRSQGSQDSRSSGDSYGSRGSRDSENSQVPSNYGYYPGADDTGASSGPDPTSYPGEKAPGRDDDAYGSPTSINTGGESDFYTGGPSGVASSTGYGPQGTDSPVLISEASSQVVSRVGALLGLGAVIMAICLS